MRTTGRVRRAKRQLSSTFHSCGASKQRPTNLLPLPSIELRLTSPDVLQLLLTAITPSSHAIPLNPFLPPAAFLAALPAFVRSPTRPTSTIWRSTTGLLRAIKLARRRLLEGALAGAGGEGRAQLPKYVVVVSATDVENLGGNEVWLEDDDQAEPWESVAKNFTRVRFPSSLVFVLLADPRSRRGNTAQLSSL